MLLEINVILHICSQSHRHSVNGNYYTPTSYWTCPLKIWHWKTWAVQDAPFPENLHMMLKFAQDFSSVSTKTLAAQEPLSSGQTETVCNPIILWLNPHVSQMPFRSGSSENKQKPFNLELLLLFQLHSCWYSLYIFQSRKQNIKQPNPGVTWGQIVKCIQLSIPKV